jgi:hypothetical protein
MNDTELDEMLAAWSAPAAPASLRERARAGFITAIRQKTIPVARMSWKTAFARRARKGLLAVAVVALAAFVLVIIQAVAQTLRSASPPVQAPYIVESEFVQYADDGSPKVEMHTTSFSQGGNEVLLSRTLPGNPIGTAIARGMDSGLLHIMPRPRLTPEMEEKVRAARADPNHISLLAGCDRLTCWVTSHYGFGGIGDARTGCAEGRAIGRETILNYPTVAAQRPLGDLGRMTVWMAPDLGCFVLKMTMEERGPNGVFRLVSGRQATKVTWNP